MLDQEWQGLDSTTENSIVNRLAPETSIRPTPPMEPPLPPDFYNQDDYNNDFIKMEIKYSGGRKITIRHNRQEITLDDSSKSNTHNAVKFLSLKADILEKQRAKIEAKINSWNKVVAVERNIRGIVVNGVPIKGKLDKLEFNGKEVNVVDYKSGNIDNALPKMKSPSDKDPNGGDYWRQAVFYKILVDNYEQKDWKVISTEFDFIEPDKKGEYRKEKIVIAPQDMETVKQQLTEVWHKIQARDFYTGCGKADCHWCNFVKNNKLAVALHDLEEETAE